MKKILSALVLSAAVVLFLLLVLLGSRRLLNPGRASANDERLQVSGLSMNNSDQNLGNLDSRDVALGDLDGDGDLDAVVANNSAGNRVWWNDGRGIFTDSGQNIGVSNSYGVALGNLDNNDGLDAFFANYDQPNTVWFNDGGGIFNDSSQALGSAPSNDVALGFLNEDSFLDAFIANGSSTSTTNEVWLNIGGGVFTDSEQTLGSSWSEAVALGKLDTDDAPDAFIANGGSAVQPPDQIWINQGGGVYTNTYQIPAFIWSTGVALGKLDADDDLDAFTTSWFPPGNKVWFNQGDGSFSDSGLTLGNNGSTSVALGDLDGDSDIDAFVGNFSISNTIWLNDGLGLFSDGNAGLEAEATRAVALGDLDGDEDLDAFLANNGANTVWLNRQIDLPRATFDIIRETNDQGHDVFYSSSLEMILPILLDVPAPEKLDVHVNINSPSESLTETFPVEAGQQIIMLDLQAEFPDPFEQHILTLYVTQAGSPPMQNSVSDRLSLLFVNPAAGPQECFLCFNTWLAWNSGFVPVFDSLHHLELSEQRDSPQWRYYKAVFRIYTPEIIDIISSHPLVLWSALATFNSWTPAVKALDDGAGSAETVTQSMVDNALDFLATVKDEATPGLQAAIDYEKQAVNMEAFIDLNMEEAWAKFAEQRPTDMLFITISLKQDTAP